MIFILHLFYVLFKEGGDSFPGNYLAEASQLLYCGISKGSSLAFFMLCVCGRALESVLVKRTNKNGKKGYFQ